MKEELYLSSYKDSYVTTVGSRSLVWFKMRSRCCCVESNYCRDMAVGRGSEMIKLKYLLKGLGLYEFTKGVHGKEPKAKNWSGLL